MPTEQQNKIAEKTVPEQLKPYAFQKGVSGNPLGRPKGSLSVIGSIKQIFEEHPEQFEEFITKYLKDPRNRQHIVEMIDGKPQGSAPIINILNMPVTEYTDEMRGKLIEKFRELELSDESLEYKLYLKLKEKYDD